MRRRRLLGALGVLAGAAVLGLIVVLVPPGEPSPSASPGVAAPDLAALAHDGDIDLADLRHDSRDDLYRTPPGAVPAGTEVRLRLRAAAGDLTSVNLLVRDALGGVNAVIPMTVEATDRTAGEHGYAYWGASLRTPPKPTILEYQFAARDGSAVRYLADDAALDGGTGNLYGAASEDTGWQITAYDPAFATPDWTRGAVVYQIFPDRFMNGDPSNDPSPTTQVGAGGAGRFRSGEVYGNPVVVKAWDELPEGYCRAYQDAGCSEGPLGRDFFGGDLAGITARLDELADLGVTALYLNPIFAAPSNHRYDTQDYGAIDPDLGSQADFDALVAGLRARGMRLILDGVFNHVSSDSPWFDRSRRFEEVGACESADSPYRGWFTFRAPAGSEPSPCAPSQPGGEDSYYVGWFGFDTIPELQEIPAVVELFNGEDGVVRHWLGRGAAGWRLDVMDNLSGDFLRQLRSAAKAVDPDALVLGEQWGDSSAWLLGDEADGVMNYRFRRAVIGLVNGPTPDLDGSIDGLSPSQFAAAMLAVREDYPAPAFDALLNLVDSHDTTRILWTLTPGEENDAAKHEPDALEAGKAKLRQVAAIQLTWPGMASIYYGDEVGLSGQDDPDDRRPYPWGNEDDGLRAFYRGLARLRGEHEALRDGDLRFVVADDDHDGLAFVRRTDRDAVLTALNVGDQPQRLAIDVAGAIPDGLQLTDALGGPGATVADGRLVVDLAARGVAVLVTPPGADLAPPPVPVGLAANASAGRVELSWPAVPGAATYRVYRSLVGGGGFAPIGDVSTESLADATVRNGTRYVYAVASIDAAGNVSVRSGETTALPQAMVADARLEGEATLSQAISALAGSVVRAVVTAPGATEASGAAIGLRLELGFGPAGSDAAGDGWTWSAMHYAGDAGPADRFEGDVRPETPGAYDVVARLSTDAGETWFLLDRDGTANGFQADRVIALSAEPPVDRDAPPAPAGLEVASASGTAVTIRWAAVEAPDLYRYQVWRADVGAAGDGEPALLGTTTGPAFTDETVQPGAEYSYAVTAQDTSFNTSDRSPPLVVAATRRQVMVTFSVTVPATTPASDAIFLAGDFQGWNPGSLPMTLVDATHWTITLPFEDGARPQYKYTRGSWEAVEKDVGCGEIPNRTIEVVFSGDGTQLVSDVVEKWRDINHCG